MDFGAWWNVINSYLVWDALWAAGIIVGMFAFAYTIGKHAMVPLLSATTGAALLATFAPFTDRIPFLTTLADHEQRVILFFVLTLVLFVIFRRNRYFEPCIVPTGWELAVFAVVYAGFLIAILASFLPSDVIALLSPYMRIAFVDDFPRLFWLLSPFAMLAVLRGGVD